MLKVINPEVPTAAQKTERLRVTILTSSYPAYRGDYAGIFIEKMALQLAAKGHKITVVAPGTPGASRHENHANLQVHRFRYFLPFLERLAYGAGGIPENLKRNPFLALLIPFFVFGFLWSAWRHSKGADLLHANWTLPAGWVAKRIAGHRNIPYVVTARGSDLNLAARNGLLRPMARGVLLGAAQVTTVSEALRDGAIQLGVPPEKVRVVPSGVAVNPTRPTGQERPSFPRPKAVFVGSLRDLKGVDVMLDALAILRDKNVPTSAWIVGDGPARQALEEQCRRLKLTDRVAFVGQRPHEEVGSWLAEADYLVLPSFSEGRPNVVYEAFAVGCPVVATDIPGTRELVTDKDRGLLVPPKDAKALAEAMEQVGTNEVLAQHLAEQASRWLTSQGLTWEICARNYLSVYQTALPSR
ncbi:MAG: glycosyltransferase [Bdellovibrionota bacterium]